MSRHLEILKETASKHTESGSEESEDPWSRGNTRRKGRKRQRRYAGKEKKEATDVQLNSTSGYSWDKPFRFDQSADSARIDATEAVEQLDDGWQTQADNDRFDPFGLHPSLYATQDKGDVKKKASSSKSQFKAGIRQPKFDGSSTDSHFSFGRSVDGEFRSAMRGDFAHAVETETDGRGAVHSGRIGGRNSSSAYSSQFESAIESAPMFGDANDSGKQQLFDDSAESGSSKRKNRRQHMETDRRKERGRKKKLSKQLADKQNLLLKLIGSEFTVVSQLDSMATGSLHFAGSGLQSSKTRNKKQQKGDSSAKGKVEAVTMGRTVKPDLSESGSTSAKARHKSHDFQLLAPFSEHETNGTLTQSSKKQSATDLSLSLNEDEFSDMDSKLKDVLQFVTSRPQQSGESVEQSTASSEQLSPDSAAERRMSQWTTTTVPMNVSGGKAVSGSLAERIALKKTEMRKSREYFYALDGDAKWEQSGVSDLLSGRLVKMGFKCPSIAQHLFVKDYYGFDTADSYVLSAETGSGKTLAIAIPIIDSLIDSFIQYGVITPKFEDVPVANDSMEADVLNATSGKEVAEESEGTLKKEEICAMSRKAVDFSVDLKQRPFLKYPKVIVFEPTAELVSQTRGVLQSVAKAFGIRVAAWSERHSAPPMHCLYGRLYAGSGVAADSAPEILVATPTVCQHALDLRMALRLSHVVFDEADTMLTYRNGHWQSVEPILQKLRRLQKDRIVGGRDSVLCRFPRTKHIFAGSTLANKRVAVFLGMSKWRSKLQKRSGLPEPLMQMFQKAVWTTTPLQHKHSPNLKQAWHYVRDNNEKQDLLLRQMHRHPSQKNRYKVTGERLPPIDNTLIFVNSIVAAEHCQRFLQHFGVHCGVLHDKLTTHERESNLNKFQDSCRMALKRNAKTALRAANADALQRANDESEAKRSVSNVLVATDLASRGLDFGCSVECVVQLDYALAADAHFNRVGRTARAGHKGFAVNIYMSNSMALAKQMQDVCRNNATIDCFFRRKLRSRLKPKVRKRLKAMGVNVGLSVAERKTLGMELRTKQASFRFNAKSEERKERRLQKLKMRREQKEAADSQQPEAAPKFEHGTGTIELTHSSDSVLLDTFGA